MFLTVHATVGAIIGQYSPNIWLAFIFGVISHYLLDAIPHGDETLGGKDKKNVSKKDIIFIIKIASLDGTTMSIFLAYLYFQGFINISLPILAGVAGSIVPDFMNGIYLLTKSKFLEKSSLFHFNLHFIFKTSVSLKVGLVIQFIFLLVATSIIIYF